MRAGGVNNMKNYKIAVVSIIAKADRAENTIRKYEDKPEYRLLMQSVYRLVVVQ